MQSFLESFFVPSLRLTVAITLAQEEDAAEPEEEYIRAPRLDVDTILDVSTINEDESVPDELFSAIRENHLPQDGLEREINPSMYELIEHKREEIAERLYHFLAFLSRNPLIDLVVYDISETIPAGMGTMLGLSDRYKGLLSELTKEFMQWLSNKNGERHETAWGTMRLEGNTIELVATAFHERLPPVEPAVYRRALKGPYSEER